MTDITWNTDILGKTNSICNNSWLHLYKNYARKLNTSLQQW